jgi:hypothetical protein
MGSIARDVPVCFDRDGQVETLAPQVCPPGLRSYLHACHSATKHSLDVTVEIAGWRRRLLFNLCDLPEARLAGVVMRRPGNVPRSLREIADPKLRGLRQPAQIGTRPDMARRVPCATRVFQERPLLVYSHVY